MKNIIHFFPTSTDLRNWFLNNHDKEKELHVGFYKTGSGKPSITWSQSVDEALCFGWIDGVRRSIDAESYQIRFTPRKPGSIWSNVNVAKAEDLVARGLMQPTGLAAYKLKKDHKAGIYAFEQPEITFDAAQLKQFTANKKAWAFFEARPASYRKVATWWVLSAKQETTRVKRMAELVSDSENWMLIKSQRR
jgi:uncharacterized protein YdeI (YjbR/CyaY-like superfamily)